MPTHTNDPPKMEKGSEIWKFSEAEILAILKREVGVTDVVGEFFLGGLDRKEYHGYDPNPIYEVRLIRHYLPEDSAP